MNKVQLLWRWADKAATRLPMLTGIWLFVYGLFAASHRLVSHFSYYDEGLLLSDAYFLLHGLVPFHDFYSNYPPAVFCVIAGIWSTIGISMWGYRLFGVVVHLAIPVVAGRLAGRISGRPFSWLAAGLVSVWTLSNGLNPHAWRPALLCALVFIELFLRYRRDGSRLSALMAGAWLGLVGCFRHDLGIYFGLTLVAACAIPRRLWRPFGLDRPPVHHLLALAGGVAISLSALWIPTFALAGFRAVARDLFFEQWTYVMPARVLPMPRLLVLDPQTHWPVFLVQDLEAFVAMSLAAPGLSLLLLLSRRWLRLPNSTAILLVGLLSVAVLPQMLGRTDVWHAAYTVTPGLVMLAVLIEAITRKVPSFDRKVMLFLALAVVSIRPVKDYIVPRKALLTSGMRGTPDCACWNRPGFFQSNAETAKSRATVLELVDKLTRPGERVFFGTFTHEWVHSNEADLYFLADRLPGVRYTQYDPNMVTRRDVQEEMIASLEKHHVRVVVLSSLLTYHEDQPGLLPGSKLLDQYLAKAYRPVQTHGVYQVLKRKEYRSATNGVPASW